MTAARNFSPSFHSAQAAATAALSSPEGTDIYFRASTLGSADAARVASRRFQVNFCALRARARRVSERNLQQQSARDTDARGAYDSLVCNRTPLGEDGSWVVSLIPASLDTSMMEMIDRATGEPVASAGKGQNELAYLATKYLRSLNTHADKGPNITRWEYFRLHELDPQFFEEFTPGDPGAPHPDGSERHPMDGGELKRPAQSVLVSGSGKPKDIADLTDEELGGF